MRALAFVHPGSLWLLALLPAVFLLARASARRRARVRDLFQDFTHVARSSRVTTRAGEAVRTVMLLGAVAALVLALARPRLDLQAKEPVYRKQDVVLILDTSLSMRATDVSPSRIARAKEEIRNFIVHRGPLVDRIGLVTFAGTSVILSYLTSDADNILFYLDFIDVAPRISYGTSIGAALANAMTLIRKESEVASRTGRDDPNQKIFLLVADGEDYGQELDDAVRDASASGIPVYAVGIGSDQDAAIPIQVPDSQYLLRDENGRLVSARFDESTLRSIALATDGRYYRSRTGAELARVMGSFLEDERQVLGYEDVRERLELYPELLLAGALLLASLLLL